MSGVKSLPLERPNEGIYLSQIRRKARLQVFSFLGFFFFAAPFLLTFLPLSVTFFPLCLLSHSHVLDADLLLHRFLFYFNQLNQK